MPAVLGVPSLALGLGSELYFYTTKQIICHRNLFPKLFVVVLLMNTTNASYTKMGNVPCWVMWAQSMCDGARGLEMDGTPRLYCI